ncbi:class I SAM-dependent methyltransferase [Vibrio sp. Of14-4]|uniref:class I SAM-dependent methyltransferase n=1 Tax=Vibrio sp. Of14-4 TaxID=2724878 RepID=UPI001EF2099B|nr:class I SAM-dependent methyltransferase [Vibrio sp. Of14-4]MCG7488041.1 class I SAM-dependent methyltransferase [Vibrio sp. Of14-4]
MNSTLHFYHKHAMRLAKQYDSLEFETVHRSWSTFWPKCGANVLDVGAGSGRDARWFAAQECSVVAVEPCKKFLQLAKKSSTQPICWVEDSLPHLQNVTTSSNHYDLILLSAVWMHLDHKQRTVAIKRLHELLASNGTLIVTLRDGEFKDGRETFGVSVNELSLLCSSAGFEIYHVATDDDSLNREDIRWQTVVIKKVGSLKEY